MYIQTRPFSERNAGGASVLGFAVDLKCKIPVQQPTFIEMWAMHRRLLLDLLERYEPWDDQEAANKKRMLTFVRKYPDCFERSLNVGHITGSAWLVNENNSRALLTHHKKLDLWLQPGGHADGEADACLVALKEAREESGISEIEPISNQIFDLDIHDIPARGDIPRHLHYDVRFLCQARHSKFRVSDESHALAWVTPEEIKTLKTDATSVPRMAAKWFASKTAMS